MSSQPWTSVEGKPPQLLLGVADTNADMARAQWEHRQRTYPVRVYRQVSRLIDRACELVEVVNLAGGSRCPAAVRDLVAELRRLAGEDGRGPSSSLKAHGEPLRLSSVLLGRPRDPQVRGPEARRA